MMIVPNFDVPRYTNSYSDVLRCIIITPSDPVSGNEECLTLARRGPRPHPDVFADEALRIPNRAADLHEARAIPAEPGLGESRQAHAQQLRCVRCRQKDVRRRSLRMGSHLASPLRSKWTQDDPRPSAKWMASSRKTPSVRLAPSAKPGVAAISGQFLDRFRSGPFVTRDGFLDRLHDRSLKRRPSPPCHSARASIAPAASHQPASLLLNLMRAEGQRHAF
jgi:hypothetical protein